MAWGRSANGVELTRDSKGDGLLLRSIRTDGRNSENERRMKTEDEAFEKKRREENAAAEGKCER